MTRLRPPQPVPYPPPGGGAELAPRPGKKPVFDSQTFHSDSNEAPLGNAIVGLVRRADGLPSVWKFTPPDVSPAERQRYIKGDADTGNKRGMWRLGYYGRAMEAGTKAQQEEATAALVRFFEDQFTTRGLWFRECLSTTHGQLYPLIEAGTRKLARHYGNAKLLELTGRAYRQRLWLHQNMRYGQHSFHPGKRSLVANLELNDIEAALLERRTDSYLRLKNGKPLPEEWWHDVYNVAALWLREMIEAGDAIGGAGRWHPSEMPVLSDCLEIHTNDRGYIAVFPKITESWRPVLFWAGVIDGQPVSAPPHLKNVRNLENPYPVPELEGATVTIVPGVVG